MLKRIILVLDVNEVLNLTRNKSLPWPELSGKAVNLPSLLSDIIFTVILHYVS